MINPSLSLTTFLQNSNRGECFPKACFLNAIFRCRILDIICITWFNSLKVLECKKVGKTVLRRECWLLSDINGALCSGIEQKAQISAETDTLAQTMIEEFPVLFPSADLEPIDFKQIPYLCCGRRHQGHAVLKVLQLEDRSLGRELRFVFGNALN